MAFFLRKSTSLFNLKAVNFKLSNKCIHITCSQFDQSTTSSSSRPDDSNSKVDQTEHEPRKENEGPDIREKILEASLPFVHELGWTKSAITAGAESLGYPGTTHGLFQQGGADLVHYFYSSSNQQLAERLKQQSQEAEKDPTRSKPPHVFVTDAVRMRLEMLVPYLDKWPQAMGLMALPNNTPRALANLLTLVDDICYYAGDRSIDITWYSRRIGLAGIYKLSELYLLQDSSPDHKATWLFLTRRVEDGLQLQSVVESSGAVTHMAKDIATATFTTARNILGLNWNR